MATKAKRKNPSTTLRRHWRFFGFLLLSLFFSLIFDRWIVFNNFVQTLLTLSTFISGIGLLIVHLQDHDGAYRILVAIPLVIMLLFGCILMMIVASPRRTCKLKSSTVAECRDGYELFGNGVPEPIPCFWDQYHFSGLIFVSGEIDKYCGYRQ